MFQEIHLGRVDKISSELEQGLTCFEANLDSWAGLLDQNLHYQSNKIKTIVNTSDHFDHFEGAEETEKGSWKLR